MTSIERFQNKGLLLRISVETVRRSREFDSLLGTKSGKQFLNSEQVNGDRGLAHALLWELLFGKGATEVKDRSIANLLAESEDALRKEADRLGVTSAVSNGQESELKLPRYARINTLKTTSEQIVEKLEAEGFKVVHPDPEKPLVELLDAQQDDEVFFDPHVTDLLIFPASASFIATSSPVTTGQLMLQDKASCMPAFLLAPPSGSQVVDACAAPGMKTTHLAAVLQGKGTVFAFDRDARRLRELEKIVRKAGADHMVRAEAADFLSVDTSRLSEVTHVLVDPPCSGSGMWRRMDSAIDSADAQFSADRLGKLANLQAMLLKQALSLPSAHRVVYSTCSVYERENEQVVQEALEWAAQSSHNSESEKSRWHLRKALPEWTHRGVDHYEWADMVVRADPQTDRTNGFFVALFVRSRRALAENGDEVKRGNRKRKAPRGS